MISRSYNASVILYWRTIKTLRRSDYLSKERESPKSTENEFTCTQCKKIFRNSKFLKKHLICHVDDRPFVCPICSRAFKRSHEVKNHVTSVHDQSKKFHCNQCDRIFKTKHGFLDHISRHLKQFVAKCEHCGKGFVTRQEHDAHVYKKHNENRETLVCFICGRTCVDKASLSSHLKTHDKDYHVEKFSCEYCGKRFAQKRGLDHHYVRIHKNGGEKFICDLCGKEVNSKRSLKGHMLLHQGIKPMRCPHCEKCFALQSTLKQHILTHTGERPHKCSECGKGFTQRGPLKAHMRSHSGEMPYVCDICPSAYPTKAQLTCHFKNKHNRV
ncbi:hypothetical protein GWI33_008321 [Rhynchophorus ferrugineus]|uniref:C2H2-type domain-containing protein n=1 Tax=Rhynchophorus ferrugineus TaxID=354439 RepID=A0A834MJC1_RHYFE|nr:hypothetical protein GWI33_008321 [Rhynchophorus ferrugineus]